MWRPNDWNNPHNPEATIFASEEAWFSVRREHKAYEADAMLEALKKHLTFGYMEDEILLDGELFIIEEVDDGHC